MKKISLLIPLIGLALQFALGQTKTNTLVWVQVYEADIHAAPTPFSSTEGHAYFSQRLQVVEISGHWYHVISGAERSLYAFDPKATNGWTAATNLPAVDGWVHASMFRTNPISPAVVTNLTRSTALSSGRGVTNAAVRRIKEMK